MDRVIFFVLFSFFLTVFSEEVEVRRALVQFMVRLSPKNMELGQNYGWNETSDPCKDKWQGVICDSKVVSVKKIVLDQFNFSGTLDASSLCTAASLTVLSLNDNSITGELPDEISNCHQMTHLYLSRNRFSGNLPASLSRLVNLKRVDISGNNFSGQLPDLPKVSGLISFLAQNNLLSGRIPDFDFSNLLQFNVSNNRFTGPIPQVNGHFGESSFLNNPGLCGLPLSIPCPNPKTSEEERNQVFMYGGYVILGLILVFLLALTFFRKIKSKPEEKNKVVKKDTDKDSVSTSVESKNGEYVSESGEIAVASSSLVVLGNAGLNEMTFEDLLQAPAELIERGKHGSLYKVVIGGMRLVVKRIRDWEIKDDDFRTRMDRISETQHPNVLPVVAYYCSRTERLLVYEFLQNGSLHNLIKENGRLFDWGSRISVAANLAEGLAFMHKELHSDGIGHGNLKSSNILLNKDVDDPVISEYGLMVVKSPNTSSNTSTTTYQHDYDIFKGDVFGFGVILLELLTGRLQEEETDGSELAKWVQSVIREEWTVEVFDKGLTSEGASQERMLNLLQLALKCTNLSPEARPSMDRVAAMINSVREDEERSISSEPWE